MMAASSKNVPRVRLQKEIINIGVEAGCETITALGTHQHTCAVLFSAATPSFKCHYISAPINY